MVLFQFSSIAPWPVLPPRFFFFSPPHHLVFLVSVSSRDFFFFTHSLSPYVQTLPPDYLAGTQRFFDYFRFSFNYCVEPPHLTLFAIRHVIPLMPSPCPIVCVCLSPFPVEIPLFEGLSSGYKNFTNPLPIF